MKNTIMIFFGILAVIMVSCQLVNSTDNTKPVVDARDNTPARKAEPGKSDNQDEHRTSPNRGDILPDDAQEPDIKKHRPNKPITQFDTEALDNQVREQAKRLGKDEKTYRMLVREDAGGTKIYRMIGMHVIVNPNGEEVYLPDEI